MTPTTLEALFTGLDPLPASIRKTVATAVTSDSRSLQKGAVFVAVRGGTRDGHEFISMASQAGVSVIVGETEAPAGLKTPYVRVPDSRWTLARLASRFYGNPSHSMKMIGVTGTSGKTTTTYLIETILQAHGEAVGVIGTVNFRFGDRIFPSTHTTPGAVELQRLLAEMRGAGCTTVVMEVSSHALKQGRSACIAFDAMVFNNLSPEHLDFHPDMEDYFQSKKLLFTQGVSDSVEAGKHPVACVHIGDSYGVRLAQELRSETPPGLNVKTFGMEPNADVSGAALQFSVDEISGVAAGVPIRAPLTGYFNAQNLLGAMTAAMAVGAPAQAVTNGLDRLKVVPGRLERVPNDRGMQVLVDYAHKPDALEKVLKTLDKVKGGGRLLTVFGCGGDRDRTKRPVMGRLASELSDLCFVTSDNPRTENPEAILQEIVAGMQGRPNFQVEIDRKKAIEAAIRAARPGDIVLIAGKGHEDYQIIADPTSPDGTRKVHFDDREVAADVLTRLA